MNSDEFRNLMYDKLLFINDNETDVLCVINTTEDVKVDEDI